MFESYLRIFDKYGPDIFSGLKLTIYITIISIIFGLFLGLILAVLKIYGPKILKILSSLYIEIIRGTPMVVQLFIIYYGIPSTGLIRFSPFFAAILGMGLNSAAYQAEYFRTAFHAIPVGQSDAALSIGMNRWKIIFYILLPQVIRITIPAWTNELIALTQYSSLAMVLTVMELTSVGKFIGSKTFMYIQSFTIITVIYVILSIVFTRLMVYFEKRLAIPGVSVVRGRGSIF
ncbi:MAG: amino acid ABC transporter permease [Caldisericia bacterium]